MRRYLSTLILTLYIIPGLAAQESNLHKGLSTISAEKISKHLSYLASDEMKGRDTPSPELDTCAAYIAREFSKYGLKPVGDNDSYFQNFNVLKNRLSEPNSFKIISEAGETEFQIKQDFVPIYLTANRDVWFSLLC